MGERPIDQALEESTNKWMQAGLVLIAVLVLAFPAYRLLEPSNRDEARELLTEELAVSGGELFAGQCAACHGTNGIDGQIGPSLNSKQFLEAANDAQITSLVSVGIPGTQMGAYSLDFGGPLTLEQITAITTYLRSLETDAPDNPDWRATLEPTIVTVALDDSTADGVAEGQELFAGQCAACHGNEGLGGTIGPSLNSKQFLESTTDDGIISLISAGVAGSAMGAFSTDFGGSLSPDQITAITTYLRSLETDAPDDPDWRAVVEPTS